MKKNRCGAKGFLEKSDGRLFFRADELISSIEYEGGLKLVLEENISVGDRIPIAELAQEHRGIAVYDLRGAYIDEGEICIKEKNGAKLVFISDYDGVLSNVSAELLKAFALKIKPELYDQIGALRRLKQIKKAFQL